MVSVGERMGFIPQADFAYETTEDGQLRVTRTSIFSRRRNTMVLPITGAGLQDYVAGRGLVQVLFPQLDTDQREFLISGATPEEWDERFGGSDED